ncbi:hypothetical protein VTH82DRAFT_2195 [Thermothelomyces myriococcoides]
MSNTQKDDLAQPNKVGAPGAHQCSDEQTPKATPVEESTQSNQGQQQATSNDQDTQISRLADDFSRLKHHDSQEAETRPSTVRCHDDEKQHSQEPPAAADGDQVDHDDAESDLSSDETPSLDSDTDTIEESPLERKRSEMIERIMKGFRASLDSKIAAIGGGTTQPKAKREVEKERAGAPRSLQAPKAGVTSQGGDQPQTGQPATDAANGDALAPLPTLPGGPMGLHFSLLLSPGPPIPSPQQPSGIAHGAASLPGPAWPAPTSSHNDAPAGTLASLSQRSSARPRTASGPRGPAVHSSPIMPRTANADPRGEGSLSNFTSLRDFSSAGLRPQTATEAPSPGPAFPSAFGALDFRGPQFAPNLPPATSAPRVPATPATPETPATKRQQNEERGPRRVSQSSKRAASPGLPSPESLLEVEDEEDGDGRRKKSKRSPNAATPGGRGAPKFACPYFKRNPKKYRKWTSCPGPGWDEVHRVKTHLYRRHTLPIQCPRCWEQFKVESQLQDHLQQDPPCPIRQNRVIQEGFTKEQEKKLRSRKKTHADMTDEDKWREIYMILFPDDDPETIPSPYYSESEDGGDNHNSGLSGELEDYATFVRREMPTLVRRELERLFQEEYPDIEERIRPRVADIVLSLQPRLLSLYKQSQMPLSEYGPQQHAETGGTASGNLPPFLTPVQSHATDPGTVSEPYSSPDMAAGAGGFSVDDFEAHFGRDLSGLGIQWGAFGSVPQMMPTQPLDGGAGLPAYHQDWESDFDKLLQPALLIPQHAGRNYAQDASAVRVK